MASAGRILIMPKGNYNSGTTYEMLDLVKHNGTSWIAKKTSVGIEPSEANSAYWQDMFDISNFEETIRDKLDKRIDAKLSLKLNDEGKLDLFVDDTYYHTIAFVE